MNKLAIVLICCLLAACVRTQPDIIVITATFEPESIQPTIESHMTLVLSPPPAEPLSNPTSDPTRAADTLTGSQEYTVQPGDTLFGIAQQHNISLDALLAVNHLENPNLLTVGQVIRLPDPPDEESPRFKIIPDSRLVRGPGSSQFDVQAFVMAQPGYIRIATDTVPTNLANGRPVEQTLSSAQVIERVSLEYSVDPRVLMMLLEYRAGWLSNPNPADELKTNPMISVEQSGSIDRSGLYRQLAWTANELNRGYYGWKNNGWSTLEFGDRTQLLFASGLNAGSVALQYFLSLHQGYPSWLGDVSETGLYSLYARYFGDPFADAVEPLVPPGITQPEMTFPFAAGETWFYTGGPHGGWGSGSAWAAVDFAPPDEVADGTPACYLSEYRASAVAPGLIVRSENGSVVLDLDGDGDESTGWTVLYLHLAAQDRVSAGTWVEVGDPIGRPACEGGFSTATHMHVARRYNGEWIPAYCHHCPEGQSRPTFVMSGWSVIGFDRQEYQGYMQKAGDRIIAEQGRLSPDNRASWG